MMDNKKPQRKNIRLKNYNYSGIGTYFITICVKNRRPALSHISVGIGLPDYPQNNLTEYGKVAEKHICQMKNFYSNIFVDKYVIMPNHVHLLLRIADSDLQEKENTESGKSRTPFPTNNPDTIISDRKHRANSVISKFVGTFKRFCNREYGENIWQFRFHDHIIRDEDEYYRIFEYIDTNVLMWDKDCFYTE